ncbi:LexA family protein [Sphingomonas ginkgonis]|nr:hypothetical protein [Sphingomonas ginkgonis]
MAVRVRENIEPQRLSPTMSSRKLQALDWIKRYFARWGHSPTQGELAAALGISGKRANDLVHALARDKMIEHVAGAARGIRLIERGEELSEADVLIRLAAMGWTIGAGGTLIQAAGVMQPDPGPVASMLERLAALDAPALTEKGLSDLPLLDHDPLGDRDEEQDGTTAKASSGSC